MLKSLSSICLASAAVINFSSAATVVVGHRGGDIVNTPENTLAAISDSFSKGIYGHELDVRRSGNQLVVIHDWSVDRTTDGTGLLNTFTTEQLRELDAGSWKGPEFAGEKIPLLSEAIDLIKTNGTRLYLDVPADYRPSEIAPLLTSANFSYENVTVLTWGDASTDRFVKEFVGSEIIRNGMSLTFKGAETDIYFAELASKGADGILLTKYNYSLEMLTSAHNAGLKVALVTVSIDSDEQARQYITEGVDELWLDDLQTNISRYNDGNGVLTIPEPSTVSTAFLSAFVLLLRRKR